MTLLPLVEDQDELVRKATSIFDFEAKDIDGNVVSLEKFRCVKPLKQSLVVTLFLYRGHVTLVVNVASE